MSTNFIHARKAFLGLCRWQQTAKSGSSECQQIASQSGIRPNSQLHSLRFKSTTSAAPQRLQTQTCDEPCAEPVRPIGTQNISTNSESVKAPAVRRFEPLDPDPYFERIDLTFSNTRECFRNKSTYELIRSIVVFQVRLGIA